MLAVVAFATPAVAQFDGGGLDTGADFGGFEPGPPVFEPPVFEPPVATPTPLEPDFRPPVVDPLVIIDQPLIDIDRLEDFPSRLTDLGLSATQLGDLLGPPISAVDPLEIPAILGRHPWLGPELPPDDPLWNPDLGGLDPIDFIKFPAGPESAGGALVVSFGAVAANRPDWRPPAVDALQTEEQRAYASSCEAAVNALLLVRGDAYKGCVKATGAALQACQAALEGYVASCLADPNLPVADLPSVVGGATLASQEQLDRIKRVVGVLFQQPAGDDGGLIFCTAVRVNNEWLATARHCVFRGEEGSPVKRDPATLFFAPFADPSVLRPIAEIRDPSSVPNALSLLPYDVLADYAFLRTVPANGGVAVSFGAPQLLDSMILFSYQYAARLAADLEQASPPKDIDLIITGDWTRFMRYDATATCAIADIPVDGCVVHACQSEVASSGAPLFRLDSAGALELLGIQAKHVLLNETDMCANGDFARTPNIGVKPRAEDTDAIALR